MEPSRRPWGRRSSMVALAAPLAFASVMTAASAAEAPPPGASAISAAGPLAPLQGTLLWPARSASGATPPIVLILPGSGPTDRDGNNPLGIRAAPYRLLAEGLAAEGIATARIDKRGIAASANTIPDANAVTVADYVGDVDAWIDALMARTGAGCIWLAGHSEGGLIALASATGAARNRICGLILIAAPGRRFDAILHQQFDEGFAGTPWRAAANAAVDRLARGEHVDRAAMPGPIAGIFAPAVQDYVIDLIRHDPAAMAAAVRVPMLIVQGDADVQVSVADARLLAAAQPAAQLAIMPHVNHVLKAMPVGADRATIIASYADPSSPIAPSVVDAVAHFIHMHPAPPTESPR